MCGSGQVSGMIMSKTHWYCAVAFGATIMIMMTTGALIVTAGALRTSGAVASVFVAPGLLHFRFFTLLSFVALQLFNLYELKSKYYRGVYRRRRSIVKNGNRSC